MAKTNFDEFMGELETDAQAEGKDAVAELRAFDSHFSAIAAQMKGARKSAGLTQQQLAAKTGLDQAEISRIENGTGDPRRSTLVRFAKGVDAELGLIFRGKVARVAGSSRQVVATKSASKVRKKQTRTIAARQARPD